MVQRAKLDNTKTSARNVCFMIIVFIIFILYLEKNQPTGGAAAKPAPLVHTSMATRSINNEITMIRAKNVNKTSKNLK